jgi:transcriptional regulator with XRE-family HTH domain
MFENDPARKSDVKRLLRQTRERRWRMTQAEMAELLRYHLDPENRGYPSDRTYARWESLKSKELPQSWKKLTAVASVMEIDLTDIAAPEDLDELPTGVVQRLDEIIEQLKHIAALLEARRATT